MKITTATYGGTFNTGNYQNQKLSLSAQLEDGDTPEQVIANLKEKIVQLAGPNIEELYREQNRLERTILELRKKAEQAQLEWEKVSQFLTAQGVKSDMAQFPQLKLLLPAATPNQQPDAEYQAVEVEEDEDNDDSEPNF